MMVQRAGFQNDGVSYRSSQSCLVVVHRASAIQSAGVTGQSEKRWGVLSTFI